MGKKLVHKYDLSGITIEDIVRESAYPINCSDVSRWRSGKNVKPLIKKDSIEAAARVLIVAAVARLIEILEVLEKPATGV